jgi:hypothetical protein
LKHLFLFLILSHFSNFLLFSYLLLYLSLVVLLLNYRLGCWLLWRGLLLAPSEDLHDVLKVRVGSSCDFGLLDFIVYHHLAAVPLCDKPELLVGDEILHVNVPRFALGLWALQLALD